MAKYITLDGLGTFLSKLKDGGYKASTSEFGAFKAAGVRSSAITSTTGTTSGRYYGVEIDSNGKAFVNVPWTDTNTDTSTTLTGHYTPSENTGSTLSAAGGTLTDIANSSSGVQVVTGLKRDAKGHVVGVNSVALKSTNTTYSAATTGATGLMSAADKTKLDGIASGANKYTLPNAGTASKPIYITGNTPTQCTSIDNTLISKSAGTSTLEWSKEVTLATIAGQAIKAKLPANPDTNSDTKVTQTVTTSNANYPLLLAPSSQTATTTTTSYFDSGVTLNPNTNVLSGAKIYEALQLWGGTNIRGGLSPLDVAMDGQWSANRLSFMPASDIKIEYSTNSGTTWTDYEASDNQKQSLVTTGLSHSIKPGKKDTRQLATKDRVRVTITASAGKTYFSLKKIYIYMSQNGANGCKVLVEKANCTTGTTTFATVGTYDISGWSGWNSIPCAANFGGGDTQTGNIRTIRLTYYFETYVTGYGEADSTSGVTSTIQKINMIGETSWANSGGSLAATGHLYSWDSYKNATFPANITATTFIGSLSGNATSATSATTAGTATKLGTATKGSATQPIYLSGGTPVACTYTLGASVPSGAKFTDTDTKVTSVDNHYKGSLGAKSSGLYKVAIDAAGHITGATAVAKADITALGIPGSDTNTDTKVTSVDNHYTPTANTGSTLSANATGATAAWSIDVVKGVTLQRDAKGHVTGVSVTSGKLPANPNTNTAHSHAAGVGLTVDGTGNTTSGTVTYKAKLKSETASTLDSVTGNTASRQYAVVPDKSGYLSVNVPWTDTNSDTKVTQTVTTTNASYPLLLAPSGQTATTTTTSYFDSGVTLNPSTNTIAANISGNSATATKLGTTTIGSASKPIYLSSGTPTACTSIDNSFISKTGGTSTLAWNSEVTLATIAGQAIKAKLPANPNSNTAHKHAAGVGLTCDNTTGTTSGTVTYTLKTASTGETGGIKVAGTRSSAVTTTQGGSAGTYYGVEIDSNGKAFVNVPPVTTASTTTYGTVKLQSGDLSGVTSHADSIAASYYHTHGQYAPKQHTSTGTTYGLGSTGGTHGHVKLISGDLNGKTAKNGEAAAAAHTHSQYALQSDMLSNEKVIATALNDLDTRLLNINRNAITNKEGITVSATDLVEGKAVYEYASPKSHATSLSIYGLGTTGQYGHVKISNGDVSTVATANGLAAGMDHYHSKTRISTTTNNAYMPMLFVNATASGDTTIYIDSSTGTGQTSSGIRYNPSGNTCYCSGGFFEASDERLKNFGDNIEVDLDKLAQLPKKYFTWKHDEDGKVHIGTSAQELQKIYPELVDTLEDGTLIVSYDTLSVIALKGIDTLYEKYKSLEERLNKIEKMLE